MDNSHAMKELLKEFIKAIQGEGSILQTGDEALKLLKHTLKARKHEE